MVLEARHHTLVQSLMSRGPAKEAQARQLHHDIWAKVAGDSQEDFLTSVGRINAALSLLQLELRAAADQADGELWYGVVNRAADSQGKLGTRYSHEEIQYFKCLVEHIVTASNGSGCISSITALHLTPAPSSSQPNATQDPLSPSSSQPPLSPPAARSHALSLTDKERLIADLAENHWLSLANDSRDGSSGAGSSSGGGGGGRRGSGVQGRVGLGVRTYLELQQYLKSIEGVVVCDVCHDAAVTAVCCASEGCEYRLHQYCLAAKFHRVKHPKCPQCDSPWPSSEEGGRPPNQTEAAGRGGGNRRRQAGGRARREERDEEGEEEEEEEGADGERGGEEGEEEEEGEEQEEAELGRRRGKGSVQPRAGERRGVRRQVVEEEEEEEEEGEEIEEVREEERDVKPVRRGAARVGERVSKRTRR
ncbi:hypothetical protein CLOM_g9996 [Closterium sp. NIES-68]|nr:hypothetical protein CLOM_g9996 [Closterium sp. NIES-68]GJP68397.1 hypothetical protein CLOP_g25115 [Closterium sp. NIES-67]